MVWFGVEVNEEIKVNGNTYRAGLRPGVILPNGEADDPNKLSIKYLRFERIGKHCPKVQLKIE